MDDGTRPPVINVQAYEVLRPVRYIGLVLQLIP